MALLKHILLVLPLAGCGVGPFDDAPGGRDNLPTRAAGPYRKLEIDFDTPADEPYVVVDRRAHVRDPAPLARDDGGVRLWFTRAEIDSDGASDTAEIWVAGVPSIVSLPDEAPSRALAADAAWEEDVVAEPSVVDLGEDHLVLYYRGGAAVPAVGRADSSDGGATWTKHPDNPLLAGARSPTAAFLPGGTVLLYYTAPGTPGILAAASDDDGVTFDPLGPVITPRPDLDEAFDADAVGDPFALVTIPLDSTGADQVHIGLFFTGTRPPTTGDDPVVSIGYAASYDGRTFARFLGPDPVLAGGPPSELGPAVLLVPAGGVLFFHEARQNRDRLAVSVHP
jgi:hypothetical protein